MPLLHHGVKMQERLLSFFVYLSDFDLFSLSSISKISVMDSLDILSLGTA